MIKTCGLAHIHLVVKDIRRSLDFYKTVFGYGSKVKNFELRVY